MATLTIILLGILNLAAKAKGECCPLRVISGMGDLDDVYTLKEEVADKPEEVCVDGCVYIRANASNSGEEYCFKQEQSSGSLECQNREDVASLDKSAIEEETRKLEEELVADQNEEDNATQLDGALKDVDNKVEQLTSSTSRSARDVPETCDQMADLISSLAMATSIVEKLSIVREILRSTITRCTDKGKLSSVKIKIRTVKRENGEILVRIRLRVREKKSKIKKNKIKLVLIIQYQFIISNPPITLPPLGPSTQTGSTSLEPGSTTTPGGSSGSTVSPGGEEPVPITPGGEEPVPITLGGEQPVPITLWGEEPVPITPGSGGEEPVPITSGGEEPVPITSGGEEPVPITPATEEPVAITIEGTEPIFMELTATTMM